MAEEFCARRDSGLHVSQPLLSSRSMQRLSLRVLLPGLVLLLFTFHLWTPRQIQYISVLPSSLEHPRTLHFLLPSSNADPNLFKAFVSARILGYPLPTIINWDSGGNSSNNEDFFSSTRFASQMDFLFSVSEYLDSLQGVGEGDLVLVADSLDTWFQLPASVLLSRYLDINARANEALGLRFGEETAAAFEQSILFGAEKKCWPSEADDFGCWAVPESPLPRTLYGPCTDQILDDIDEYQYMRPRYLNAGFTIGEVSQMRLLFRHAAQLARKDPNVLGADQGVQAQILGQQEYMRELLYRERTYDESSLSKREKVVDFKPQNGTQYEFGIGLDYDRSLTWATAHAEDDAQWVNMGDEEMVKKAIQDSKIDITTTSVFNGLQKDLQMSSSPFHKIQSHDSWVQSLKKTTWADVPLYTDLWTGITPAIIHFNAKDKMGHKDLRDNSWSKMWFSPYAGRLFNGSISDFEEGWWGGNYTVKAGDMEFQGTVPNRLIKEKGFGTETIDKSGKRGWIAWDDLCDKGQIDSILG